MLLRPRGFCGDYNIPRPLLNAVLGLKGEESIKFLEINDPNLLENYGDK